MEETKDLPKSTYPYWARFGLDNPIRRKLINRRKLVKEAGVEKGMTVFEMGFGVGFFTEFLAKAAGTEGSVYSQDVEPRMLEILTKKMRSFEIAENIKPIITSSTSLPLDDNSVDLIFTANVFEEVEKEGLLIDTISELKRISKKGTKLFFMEHVAGVGLGRINIIDQALQDAGFKQTSKRKTRFNFYANYIYED